jgi:dihydroorotase
MINLETSFAAANTALKDILSKEELISKFTSKPKAILGLKNEAIEEGCLADLTLFNPEFKWKYEQENIVSKSKNSGLIGKKFTGKALAVINNGQMSICN